MPPLNLHLAPAQNRKPKGRPPQPEEAWKLYSRRKASTKVYRPVVEPAKRPKRAEVATVPAPPSIVELARGLKNDVDLIYEWVYSNVDFYCMWGLHKGALGTLIDGIGGSFEQSALMVSLLRQSGYTANFVAGTIRLTLAQIQSLLGVTETIDNQVCEVLLSVGQIPFTAAYDETGLLEYVDLAHIWVQVTISGTDYVFDPTLKTYNYTTGVDIGSIVGFDQTTLDYVVNDPLNLFDPLGFAAACPKWAKVTGTDARADEFRNALNKLDQLAQQYPQQFPALKQVINYFQNNPISVTPQTGADNGGNYYSSGLGKIVGDPTVTLKSTAYFNSDPTNQQVIQIELSPLESVAHELGHAFQLANPNVALPLLGPAPITTNISTGTSMPIEKDAFILENEIRNYQGNGPRYGYGSGRAK